MATQDGAAPHRAGAAPLAGTGFVSVGANVHGEQIIVQTNFSTCDPSTVVSASSAWDCGVSLQVLDMV